MWGWDWVGKLLLSYDQVIICIWKIGVNAVFRGKKQTIANSQGIGHIA